ncbi:IS66 family insertion sequence element accessory protein TnpB [Pseudomonas luteola]
MVVLFSAAKPHCAYLFANRHATRMKVLVHDGIGVWLAALRLSNENSIGPLFAKAVRAVCYQTTSGLGACRPWLSDLGLR